MPEIFRAARALPMTPGWPVVEDAAAAVRDGTILAFGAYADIRREYAGPVRDLGGVTLAPAALNSHVHLEMSHLLGKTVQGQGFVSWVKSLLAQNLYGLDEPRVRAELARLESRGTAFVADISTRNAQRLAAILAGSGHFFASFQEAIGTTPPEDPDTLLHHDRDAESCGRGVLSVAGHALYSTSPELLRAAKGLTASRGLPFSLHLAEHEDEDAILLSGKSPFLDLLMERGFMTGFDAPGVRPVPLAQRLGLLDRRTLAVHCVRVSDEDLDGIAKSGASVCLCPRSNEFIGVGRAPAGAMLARGINVCLGTDGLCSNDDLDVYGELAWLGRNALPGLGLAQGLALITSNPARFFGLDDRLGSLAPGRQARFSVVPQDVLEALGPGQ